MKLAWVQIDPDTQLAVRIFKNRKSMVNGTVFEATLYGSSVFKLMDRGLAVSQIRRQVWNRQEGLCARCPETIRWNSMHMHEVVPKGQGGEVSLQNCEGLCYACHLGPSGAHPEKQVMFTKRTEEEK